MVKKPRIEIYSEKNTKGRAELGFRVRSKNGRTVTSSTGYNTFQGAQKSINALTEIMKSNPKVVDLRETLKRGKKPAVAAKPAVKPKAKPAPKKKAPAKTKAKVTKHPARNGRMASKIVHATRRLVAANRRGKVTHGRKTASKSSIRVAA